MNDLIAKKKKYANQEGWLSIWVNTLLFVLKYWAGINSGSLALIADAWHTLSDSISSIAILIGAWISGKKPDKKHPYGHGRFELITSLFIGILLIGVGVGFFIESYHKFQVRQPANFGTLAIVVTIVSIVSKEAIAQFAFWAARKSDSSAIKADGWHHRSDAISSLVLLAGILLQSYFWWIDAFLGVVIAGFIIYTAIKIIGSIISVILGEEADEKLKNKIKTITFNVAGKDLRMHHCHYHNYIMHKELTFHICLPPDNSIKESHQLVKQIETQILNELDIHATIRIEPIE